MVVRKHKNYTAYKAYQDRLIDYEEDKRKLREKGLAPAEYEAELRKLIEKHRI